MVKSGKRGREDGDTYDSDGGFVSNDEAPKSKKTKKAGGSSKDGPENKFWGLSSGRQPRRVEISEFKDMKLISIREFYEKDEQYLPGKKGISLTIDQYKALLKAIPEINASLGKMGVNVGGSDGKGRESEEETKPQKRVKAKKEEKSNIEATSEEEDEEDDDDDDD